MENLCVAMFCSRKGSAAVSGGNLSLTIGLEVDRRGLPLLPALELVTELLVFIEGAQPCSLNGRYMNKYVIRAVIGLNKSVALLGVEPLYCSASHCTFLLNNTTAFQQSRHGT